MENQAIQQNLFHQADENQMVNNNQADINVVNWYQGGSPGNAGMIMCGLCGMRQRSRSHLEIHMRTHTGERPFKCTMCQKTFTRKFHLDRHMKSLHSQSSEVPE